MKSYVELKTEIGAIQQQIIETKKNTRTNTLRRVKLFCKEFSYTATILKGSLAKGRSYK